MTIGASAEGAIVVTGGLGGIGQAVVQAILEDTEYRCAVLDLAESGPHRDADRVLTVGCDVTASDQVAAAIAAVDEWGGPIVGLVNSAGVAHHIPPLSSTSPSGAGCSLFISTAHSSSVSRSAGRW